MAGTRVDVRQSRGVVRLLQLENVSRRDGTWLVLMAVMLFVLLLPISSYVAALSFIKDEWAMNNTQAGVVFSSSLVGYALSALFIIPLTDRFGPKPIMLVSIAVSITAHLLFPLVAENIVVGVALRAISGAGFVGAYMPGLRIIAERFSGGAKGTAVGLFVTAQYGAHAASLAITGTLMSSLEWRDAYLVVSLVSIASLPMAYLLVRLVRADRCWPAEPSSGRLDFAVLENPMVRYLILGYSLHAWQVHAVRTWLPGFFLAVLVAGGEEGTQAVSKAGTVAGLVLVIGAAGPLMGGVLSDRFGRSISASAIFALAGVCGWTIGWMDALPWALVVGVGSVYGWAVSADSAIYSAGITDVTRTEELGSAMALQAFVALMAGAAGPIAFGGVLDLSSEAYKWGLAFSSVGLFAIVAIAGLQRLRSLPQSRLLARGRR